MQLKDSVMINTTALQEGTRVCETGQAYQTTSTLQLTTSQGCMKPWLTKTAKQTIITQPLNSLAHRVNSLYTTFLEMTTKPAG